MQVNEVLVHLDLGQVVLAITSLVELLLEVLSSNALHALKVVLEVFLELLEDDGQQNGHNNVETDDQVAYEEEAVEPVLLVSRQHDVRVVGGRH